VLLQVLRLWIMRRRLLLLNLLHLGKTRRQLLGMIEHLCVRACLCVCGNL
jgi:hypothetical protein